MSLNAKDARQKLAGTGLSSKVTSKLAELFENNGNMGSGRVLSDATAVLSRDENGGVFFLARAGGITVTLPPPELGLNYTFFVATAPTSDVNITTSALAVTYRGNIVEIGGTSVGSSTTNDVFSFKANAALVGDEAHIWSNGSLWFIRGVCAANAGVAFSASA